MSKANNSQIRLGFLKNNKINYLLISDFESKLGDLNPDKTKYLQKIYGFGSVVLYKVSLVG